MNLRNKVFTSVLGFLAMAALAPAVHATPIVTYTLSLNDNGAGVATPGDFAVYASDSTGDNYGIAAFLVDITGATTITNVSPKGVYDDGTGTGGTDNIGFTLLRSGNGSATTNNPIYASEDTVDSSGFILVFGFGQTGGNLNNDAPANSAGALGKVQTSYNAPLLLATGTYSGAAGSLYFTSSSSSNLTPSEANVFTTNSGIAVTPASIDLVTASVPEPATVALFALAGLGILTLGRKRKSA